MGIKATVDVFIYNYDPEEFETIVDNNLNNYDYFVILPHFKSLDTITQQVTQSHQLSNTHIIEVIKKIPREKVLIVDRFMDELKDYPVVYQEYDKDIQSALLCGLDLLRKYNRLNLVFPKSEFYPPYIVRGFQIFCQVQGFDFSIIDGMEATEISRGEAYIIVSDEDLYAFIRKLKQKNWALGTDCGVVAYNENQVKEILCEGITTISTNHEEIGQLAAQMILTKRFESIKSPFSFIRRNSL